MTAFEFSPWAFTLGGFYVKFVPGKSKRQLR